MYVYLILTYAISVDINSLLFTVFSLVTTYFLAQTFDQSYRNFVCVFVTSTEMLNHTYASANQNVLIFGFGVFIFLVGQLKKLS